MNVREIAEVLQCRLEGNGDVEIHGIAGLEKARAGELTFFVNAKYARELRVTEASAVIIGERAQG